VAVAAVIALTCSGCFSVAGLTIGAIVDHGSAAAARPAPVVVLGAPGSGRISRKTHRRTEASTGTPAATKGLLIGGIIDLALIGLTLVVLSQLDFSCFDPDC